MQRHMELRRFQLHEVLVAEWRDRLSRPKTGLVTMEVVQPVLENWLGRRHGSLSFRVTQVLSGHGCFGKYLCRINRELDARCNHCVYCREHTARHTLAEYASWEEPRRALISEVGSDLSLPAIVESMVSSEESWDAVISFCK